MCWAKLIVTGSLDTGADHVDFEKLTLTGSGSVNVPLLRRPPEVESVASPAVEITLADVLAVYVWSAPGANAPNVAGAPSVSASVAGTVAPGPPGSWSSGRPARLMMSVREERKIGAWS